MKLLLIRGLPGSGKSTKAKGMQDYYHLEADMFFMINGEYKYNITKVPDNHEWCISQTKYYLNRGLNVVVSNTFCQEWEVVPYRDIAKKYGAQLEIITMYSQFKNVHNVPKEVIERMKKNFEEIES